MNLILSGAIDAGLRNAVLLLCGPDNVAHLNATAYRFERADASPATRAAVAALCEASRVDHAFVEEGLRFNHFKLLAIDMDSTLISIECIDELADVAGKKGQVAAITEATMRGDISDFSESLRQRVALLQGAPIALLDFVYEHRLKLTAGATELIAYARQNHIHTLLVSGGFTFFTDRLRRRLSIDEAYANTLLYSGDKLTGEVLSPILDAEGKRAIVESTASYIKCSSAEILVIGDGANDIPMMQQAHNSIAYHGKPIVRNVATHSIQFGTLQTVLDYFSADNC